MPAVRLYTLDGWEGTLPECSNCHREVRNGEQYGVVAGDILFLCTECAGVESPLQSKARTQQLRAAEQARAREVALREQVERREAREIARLLRAEIRASQPKKVYQPRVATCPRCGTEFTPASHGSRGRQKFCSKQCSPGRPPSVQPGICPPCGRPFHPVPASGPKQQIACSKQCARLFEAGKTNPNPAPLKWSSTHDQCLDCGRSDRPYKAKGWCTSCYYRRYMRTGLMWQRSAPPVQRPS